MTYSLFGLDLKETEPVSFGVLRGYLERVYAETAEKYEGSFLEIAHSRHKLFLQDSEDREEHLAKYYGYLRSISSRFPVNEDNIKIAFPWYNSFPKDKRLITCFDIGYEKASVLYNIAVLNYKTACSKDPNNTDELRISCNLFMVVAGILEFILSKYCDRSCIANISDVGSVSVKSLIKLMLALSQECFVLKAVKEGAKDSIVCGLAVACADMFRESLNILESDDIIYSSYGSIWTRNLEAKFCYYYAFSQFIQSTLSEKKGLYGEKITRLKSSLDIIDKAISIDAKNMEYVDLQGRIDTALKNAIRENDLIYHDSLPLLEDIDRLSRKVVVKPKCPSFIITPISAFVLFRGLLPIFVKDEFASLHLKYIQKSSANIIISYGRLRSNTAELVNIFEGYNDVCQCSLKLFDKKQSNVVSNALASLVELRDEFLRLFGISEENLKKCSEKLSRDETQYNSLRMKHSNSMKPLPSSFLNKSLWEKYRQYTEQLLIIMTSNKNVLESCKRCERAYSYICDPFASAPKLRDKDKDFIRNIKENLETLSKLHDKIEENLGLAERSDLEKKDYFTEQIAFTEDPDDQMQILRNYAQRYKDIEEEIGGCIEVLKQVKDEKLKIDEDFSDLLVRNPEIGRFHAFANDIAFFNENHDSTCSQLHSSVRDVKDTMCLTMRLLEDVIEFTESRKIEYSKIESI